jgi:hypothetical protein
MKENQQIIKSMEQERKKEWGFIFVIMVFILLCIFLTNYASAQASPSQDYYNTHIGDNAPSAELPSDAYYNNHLRAGGDGWEEDGGPGGGGTGGNTGVGVPVGSGTLSVAAAVMAYAVFLIVRKRKRPAVEI